MGSWAETDILKRRVGATRAASAGPPMAGGPAHGYRHACPTLPLNYLESL